MITCRMIRKNDEELKEIRRLYNASFPEDERIPYHRLISMLDDERIMHGYYEDGVFIGMTYIFLFRDIAYLGYLAVEEEQRKKGHGTEILEMLCGMYSEYRIVIDIEVQDDSADNADERRKRRGFYILNHFESTDIFYSFDDVEYEILSRNGMIERSDWRDMIREHWGRFADRARFRQEE